MTCASSKDEVGHPQPVLWDNPGDGVRRERVHSFLLPGFSKSLWNIRFPTLGGGGEDICALVADSYGCMAKTTTIS